MTETSYYWDGLVTGDASLAPYSPFVYHGHWQKMFTSDPDEGIVAGYENELAVAGIAGGVTVAIGAALVEGTFYENDSQVTVTIPTPVSNPRIDIIALTKDHAAQTVRITRVAGTEAASPTAPSITQTAGAYWQIPLAQVTITTAGVITVSTATTQNASTRLIAAPKIILLDNQISDGTTTSFDFTNISQAFQHLLLVGSGRQTSIRAGGFADVVGRFNSDNGANYNVQVLQGGNSTVAALGAAGATYFPVNAMPNANADAGFSSQFHLFVPNYKNASLYKSIVMQYPAVVSNSSGDRLVVLNSSIWKNVNPITRIQVFDVDYPSSPFSTSSQASLYGLK